MDFRSLMGTPEYQTASAMVDGKVESNNREPRLSAFELFSKVDKILNDPNYRVTLHTGDKHAVISV